MTQRVSTERPWGLGRIVWVRDATANDSDKSFTVPADKIWDLKMIAVELVNTATVGNRQLLIRITDGTNIIWHSYLVTNTPASQAATFYLEVNSGVTRDATTRFGPTAAGASNIGITESIPPLLLPAGYVIRVWDYNAIDAAADDMVVELHYIEYDA